MTSEGTPAFLPSSEGEVRVVLVTMEAPLCQRRRRGQLGALQAAIVVVAAHGELPRRPRNRDPRQAEGRPGDGELGGPRSVGHVDLVDRTALRRDDFLPGVLARLHAGAGGDVRSAVAVEKMSESS